MPTMTPSELRSRLTGVVGFPVTPFSDALAVDLAGLRANVAAMTAHPFCCIVAAGGTGELYSLNTEEHTAVVRTSVEATAGRTAVIAGVGGNIGVAVEQATKAWKAGRRRHPGAAAVLPARGRGRAARLLRGHRRRDAAGPAGLQPRLGQSRTGVRREARRSPDSHRLEGRPGRRAPLPDHHGRRRRSPALGRRRRRRSGRHLLPSRHPLLHVEHLERVAEARTAAARRRGGRRRSEAARADAPLRGAALRLPRAQEGLRGVGDEGDDADAGSGRRPGASAARATSTRASSTSWAR